MSKISLASLTIVLLAGTAALARAEDGSDSRPLIAPLPVFADLDVSRASMAVQEGLTGKVLAQHRALKAGGYQAGQVLISGLLKGTLMLEGTNTAGKFPILSRFPAQHPNDTFGSRFVINNAMFGITASLGRWGYLYLQPEYSEVEFARDQSDFQMRQAFVAVGDLERFPVMFAFGRKTIEFGEFDSYNPFTHNINTHFFWAVADEPVLEANVAPGGGFEASVTAINGSRHLRVADAGKAGHVANFAVKLKQTVPLFDDTIGTVTVSYLHDTIYRNNFTNHTAQCLAAGGGPNCGAAPPVFAARRNGAYDITLSFHHPRFDLQAAWTSTVRDWLATNHRVDALTLQGRWRTSLLSRPFALSAVFSTSNLGPDGTEFDRADQHVLGAEWTLSDNLQLGAEVVYNHGFQPLINIATVSDQSVTSITGILGAKVQF